MTLDSDRAHLVERLDDMAARCEMDGKHEDAKALQWAVRRLDWHRPRPCRNGCIEGHSPFDPCPKPEPPGFVEIKRGPW